MGLRPVLKEVDPQSAIKYDSMQVLKSCKSEERGRRKKNKERRGGGGGRICLWPKVSSG